MAFDLCSAQGASPPARHELRNEREAADALIYWLDYEGRAVQYGTLAASKSLQQGTCAGRLLLTGRKRRLGE